MLFAGRTSAYRSYSRHLTLRPGMASEDRSLLQQPCVGASNLDTWEERREKVYKGMNSSASSRNKRDPCTHMGLNKVGRRENERLIIQNFPPTQARAC